MTAEREARRLLDAVIADVGVEPGDTVYLGIDMGRIPLPSYEAPLSREGVRMRELLWCAFLYDVLRDRVGDRGTLLAPAFSYAYARAGTVYIHEESPSETGPFTEFLRTHAQAVRSFHPLNSVCAVGPEARPILDDTGRAGYGALSPFARLRSHRTKFLFLGAPLAISLTHAHHLEHMYGVNHMYHKVYTTPAFRSGKMDQGPWLCFVRYLGAGVEPSIGKLEERLRELRLLREVQIDPGPVQCVRIEDVEDVGYDMLKEDPCAFLARPLEIHVDAPGTAEQPVRHRRIHLALTADGTA
jgi:aminoglycoside N3'-acetyltransferase